MIERKEISRTDLAERVIVEWCDDAGDYLVTIPEVITRCDLTRLVEEIYEVTGGVE